MLVHINIGKVTVNHSCFLVLILLYYTFRLLYPAIIMPEDIKEKLPSTISYQFYNIYVLENDERYQLDEKILFIIINKSACFGHLYAHLQESIGCILMHMVFSTRCCG